MLKSVLDRLRGVRPAKEGAQGPAPGDQYLDLLAAPADPLLIPGWRREAAPALLGRPAIDLRLLALPGRSGESSGNVGKLSAATAREVAGTRAFWDFLRAHSLADVTSLVLTGHQGSGRSTLLKHIAYILATRQHARFECAPYLPVYVPVARHARTLATEPSPDLAAFLQAVVKEQFPGLALPDNFFAERLKLPGQTLILFDGIDEVDEIPMLGAIGRWLNKQVEAFPGQKLILTLRPGSLRELRLEKAATLEVQPVRGDQVRRFLEEWFAAHHTGKEEAKGAAKAAQSLLNLVRATPSLATMTASPLLLGALAEVYEHFKGELPAQRGPILDALTEVLERHELRKNGLDLEERLQALRLLADQQAKTHGRDLSGDDLSRLLEKLPFEGAADALRKSARHGRGVLTERELGHYRVRHQSIQDDLIAMGLERRLPGEKRLEQMISDTHWHEALALLAGRADASAVVKGCLTTRTVSALTLAAECLEMAGTERIDPETRKEAEAVLVAPLGGDERRARRQATEVRLARRLKNLVRMDEQREIDPSYVTCAEYQLFMEEMKERGHFYQPDHWTAMRFAKGDQNRPVTGVRPEDARDFCVWLNMRSGQAKYRLPRPEEARLFPAPVEDLAAWCQEGSLFTLVGLGRTQEAVIAERLGKIPLLSLPKSLPLERALNREVDALFSRTLLKVLDLRADAIVEKGVVHALDHVRELVMVRALELGTVISPDLDLAKVLCRASTHTAVANAVERYDLPNARRELKELAADYDEATPEGRFAVLLGAILDAVEASKVDTVLQAQRRCLALMASWVYEEYGLDEALNPAQKRQRQQGVLEFHGWLQLMLDRAGGKLPAWEAIRLVRDQALAAAGTLDLPSWAYNA